MCLTSTASSNHRISNAGGVPIAGIYLPTVIYEEIYPERTVATVAAEPPSLTVWDLAARLDRSVLLGDPGGGKTTASTVLMHHFASDPSRRVPFLTRNSLGVPGQPGRGQTLYGVKLRRHTKDHAPWIHLLISGARPCSSCPPSSTKHFHHMNWKETQRDSGHSATCIRMSNTAMHLNRPCGYQISQCPRSSNRCSRTGRTGRSTSAGPHPMPLSLSWRPTGTWRPYLHVPDKSPLRAKILARKRAHRRVGYQVGRPGRVTGCGRPKFHHIHTKIEKIRVV
jgi:hypothetical protein